MITIEKAIRNLTFWEPLFKDYHDQWLRESLRLGIEALKRIQSKRITMSYHPDDLLPGEEKE